MNAYTAVMCSRGDILIPEDQIFETRAAYESALNKSIVKLTNKWPGGVIPYVIADNVYNEQIIREAIALWEGADTAVTFTEGRPEFSFLTYLHFEPSAGNSSYVGMVFIGPQPVKLSSGASRGTAIHEIGHALGLEHEHTRADRDDYVIIHEENIIPGKEHNFEKHDDKYHRDIGPFDFGSIMLYSSYAFSVNGLPTITLLDGSTYYAQRNTPSTGDIAGVQYLYGIGSASYLGLSNYSSLVCQDIKEYAAWGTDGSWSGRKPFVLDLNGDGRDDLFMQYPNSDYASLLFISNGNGFTRYDIKSYAGWGNNGSWSGRNPFVLDVNGDGRDDLFMQSPTRGYASLLFISEGNGFSRYDIKSYAQWGQIKAGVIVSHVSWMLMVITGMICSFNINGMHLLSILL